MSFIDELIVKAKKNLPKSVIDFIEGGAGDESAVMCNRKHLERITLIPRVLVDVTEVDTEASIFGRQFMSPLLIAPTAPHQLVHPEAELATAQAAAKTKNLMIVSCMASRTLEEIAAVSTDNLWLQLHIFRDRQVTERLLRRAEEAGYKAIVITVDMPIVGDRRRNIRNRFRIPANCLAANLLSESLIDLHSSQDIFTLQPIDQLFDPSVTWDDIAWIQAQTQLPVLLKGILNPKDALIAKANHIDGIIVSNHGGRQLDASAAPVHMLPKIARVLEGSVPLFVDGGFRSGADVLKAILLGAQGVLLGRPVLWGLANGGMHGVSGVLKQFQRELVQSMKLCGLISLSDLKEEASYLAFEHEFDQ